MQRWTILALLMLIPLGARMTAAQAPPPVTPLPTAARFTLALEEATLPEAVAALSRAIRLPMVLSAEVAKQSATRRARLAITNATLSRALREFGRVFDCTLSWEPLPDAPGCGFRVLPGPAPGGPEFRLPGYRVAVLGLTFTDQRSFDEDSAAIFTERSLGLSLSARAENGDIAPIESLDNIRVVDQNGRDALATAHDRDGDEPETEVDTTLPDEQPQQFVADWPYPAPHRLKLIEGELVLYRKVRRTTLRLPIPEPGALPSSVRFGDARAQLLEDTPGRRYLLRVTHSPGITGGRDLRSAQELTFAGEFPFFSAMMPDGTPVPLNGSFMGRTVQTEGIVEEIAVPAVESSVRPTHLVVRLALRSELGRRLRFRIENFPAILAPREAGTPMPIEKPLPGKTPAVKPGGVLE